MSDRQPATDKGTADRVEADNGGYWCRLVTKQALRREGECMDNCLARGEHEDSAGEEELVSTAIWSLRKATGISYLTTSVYAQRTDTFVGNTAGPSNSQPSAWSIRQLRHLVAAFREAGATLRIPDAIALTGDDGRTWRPDKAPQEMRGALAARQRQEHDEAAEYARARGDLSFAVRNDSAVRAAHGLLLARRRHALQTGGQDAAGDLDWQDTWAQSVRVHLNGYLEGSPIVRAAMESIRRNIVGDGPVSPASDVRDEAPAGPDGAVFYRTGPNEPFQVLRGRERQEAISAAMRQGIITGYESSMVFSGRDEPAVETITVRLGGYPARHTTQNEDGTYRLNLGDLVFPKVMPSGDIGFGSGEVDTVTFRIAPAATRVARRARLTPVSDPANPPGPITTDLSAEIRMTPIRFEALTDAFALLHGDGPSPGGGADGSFMREPEQVRDDGYALFAREYLERRLGDSYDRSDAPELACLRSACEAGITSPEAIEGYGLDWSRRSAGQKRATIEIKIARIEWALASGTGRLSAGTAQLRRLYRELERLGGPPVRRGRLVRSDEPGISPGDGGGAGYAIMAPGGCSSTQYGPPLSEG